MELNEKIKEIIHAENQPKIRVDEEAIFEKLMINQDKYLKEETFAGDISQIGQLLIPVYRRVFPQLIGKDLVGVQPLTQPTGYAFALRYHYAGNTTGNGANRVIGGASAHPSAYNYNWTAADNQRTAANSLLLVYTTTAARQAGCPNVAANAAPVAGIGDLSGLATVIYTEENKAVIRAVNSAAMTTIKALADATGTALSDVYDNEAGFINILRNYPGPVSTATGEALNDNIDEIGLTIDKIAVEAQVRKLKAKYTLESAQDLKAVHGKDMAKELVDILTYEISQSVDRDIIAAINSLAITSSFNVNSDSDGRWQVEKFRGMYSELVRKSNDIARTTLRGPGNVVIASPDVVTALEQVPGFLLSPVDGKIDSSAVINASGSAKVGTLGGRFTLYRDNFGASDYATVMYKGSSNYDAAVIYCPYVPLMMKETVDYRSGQPSIIFMERSAIMTNIFASDKYVRKISFSNIFSA